MKKIFVALVGGLCLCILTVTLGINAEAAEPAKVHNWRFFISYPPTMFPVLQTYPEMVKKETNGRLDIKLFFFGEHPYKGSEIMPAIRDQRCQMGEIEGIYYAGTEPALALTGTPMVAGPIEQMFKMHEAQLKSGTLSSVYEKYNMSEVAYWAWFGPTISCRDTLITSMDSLKGKKIRVPSKQHGDMISWIGGSPVTIAWGEVYTALQRGVIDGAIGSLAAQRDSKWFEVCRYTTRMAEAFGLDRIGVNKDVFNGLPPDVQKGFLRATKEYERVQREHMRTNDALACVEIMHKNGVTIRAMPPEILKEINKRAPAYTKEWAQTAGKGAPEAYNDIAEILNW